MGMNGLQRWTAEQALSAHHATAFCTSSKIQTRNHRHILIVDQQLHLL